MRVKGLTPQELKAYGINDAQDVVYNPDYDTLYREELNPELEGYERGVLTNLEPLQSIQASLPAVRRKINISSATTQHVTRCGGRIMAREKMTTSRCRLKPGNISRG